MIYRSSDTKLDLYRRLGKQLLIYNFLISNYLNHILTTNPSKCMKKFLNQIVDLLVMTTTVSNGHEFNNYNKYGRQG